MGHLRGGEGLQAGEQLQVALDEAARVSEEEHGGFQLSLRLGTIHKGRPQNFGNFQPPPCPHFG